jgi:hypothetical protein
VASPISEPERAHHDIARTDAGLGRGWSWKDPLLALWLLSTGGFWMRFWEGDLYRARCRVVLLAVPAAILLILAVRRALGISGWFRGLVAGTAVGLVPVWLYFVHRLSPAGCGSGPSPLYQVAMLWTQAGYLYLFCLYTLFLLLADGTRRGAQLPRARVVGPR